MNKFIAILLALTAFAGINVHAQKFESLALTPPMGWNSWNRFAGDINEDLIRQTADAMATNGMRDAGYVYIVVDDCREAKERAHFSMWCMLAAPLIAGNDMTTMSPEAREILTNPEAIAVGQDKLGIQGFKYSLRNGIEIWFKPLNNDAWAMAILNRGTNSQPVDFNWKNETVADGFSKREAKFDTATYSIRDLWMKKDLGTTRENLNTVVPGHDVLMLRLDKM